jgi:hypothetical protein
VESTSELGAGVPLNQPDKRENSLQVRTRGSPVGLSAHRRVSVGLKVDPLLGLSIGGIDVCQSFSPRPDWGGGPIYDLEISSVAPTFGPFLISYGVRRT